MRENAKGNAAGVLAGTGARATRLRTSWFKYTACANSPPSASLSALKCCRVTAAAAATSAAAASGAADCRSETRFIPHSPLLPRAPPAKNISSASMCSSHCTPITRASCSPTCAFIICRLITSLSRNAPSFGHSRVPRHAASKSRDLGITITPLVFKNNWNRSGGGETSSQKMMMGSKARAWW